MYSVCAVCLSLPDMHLTPCLLTSLLALQTLAGFCRNCMAKWYVSGAKVQGCDFSYDSACEIIYGMSYGDWKKKFQTPATPEMLAAFKANKHRFAKHDEEGAAACGCGSNGDQAGSDLPPALSTLPEAIKVQCEAYAFSKFVQHLQIR